MENTNEGVAARTTSTVSTPGVSFDAAGHECMSEDECIAAGVNFAGYERGVADAIDACEKLAKLRASTSTASAPSQTQSAPISTPAIGAPHSGKTTAANAGGQAIQPQTVSDERKAFDAYWNALDCAGATDAEIEMCEYAAWQAWQARPRHCLALPLSAYPAGTTYRAPTADAGGLPVVFMGGDPLNIAKGATLPMISDSWRFGFYKSGDELRFGYQDNGQLVAWDAVKDLAAKMDRAEFEQFCDDMIDGTDTVSRDWLFHFCTTLLARRAPATSAAALRPSVGEIWHVRYQGAKALSAVVVKEVTGKTVCVSDADRQNGSHLRYTWDGLEFVERVGARAAAKGAAGLEGGEA